MKNFQIWQRTNKKSDKEPDYDLVHWDPDKGENIYIGVAWKKLTKENKPFLSVQMNNAYKDKPGYEVVEENKTTSEKDWRKVADSTPF